MKLVETLGIVLAHGPESADARWALELAIAATRAGKSVTLFAMDRGVLSVTKEPRFAEVCAELIVCGTSCERFSVVGLSDEIVIGSQADHARLVASADRLAAFT